ncbi:MAG: MFS transporter [bacterium]
MMARLLKKNITNYAWFQFSSSLFGWLPVFFLFFNQFVGLSDVILLGAFYYFCVCICEVPSGYLSDRIGRRITLLIASYAFILSNLAFIIADGFALLVLGQFFLAMGMAMLSGTDTAFLYDSLLSAKREQEYAAHEARGQAYAMTGLAISSLIGGALGMYDLRWPYYFSLLGSCWMLWLVWHFIEPMAHRIDRTIESSFLETIGECIRHLKDRMLAWLFAVMILMYSLEHVVYEFYQPYIKLLGIDFLSNDSSPLVSGVVIAASMFGGTIGATYSVRLNKKLGIKVLLFSAFAIQLTIIASISVSLSYFMLCMVVLRNFPMAMIHAPVNAAIAPRIGSHLRASYLSVQSLSARLAFSGLLLVLSTLVPDVPTIGWENLSLVLRSALLYGIIGVLVIVIMSPSLKKSGR